MKIFFLFFILLASTTFNTIIANEILDLVLLSQENILKDNEAQEDSSQNISRNEFSESNPYNKILFSVPYLEMTAGTGLGVNQAYSTLGVLTTIPISISIASHPLLFYNDTCWHRLLKGTNAASLEGGFIWKNELRSFCGYIGYDWRRRSGHSFHQISGGFQINCSPWDVNVNLNYPLQSEINCCSAVFNYDAGYMASVNEFNATYRICSVNIAGSFCTCLPNLCFSVGLEPYFLMSGSKNLSNRIKKGWGGKARVLFNLDTALHIEASISNDKIFNSRAQIVLGIDLLQFFKKSSCCCFSFNSFKRQKLIAIKHIDSWQYNW